MSEELNCCPECDSARYRPTSQRGSPSERRYRCRDCGAQFDELSTKTSDHARAVNRGYAAMLDNLDADALDGLGGGDGE